MGPMVGLWRRENSVPPPGIEPRTVQPVASHYTVYAILFDFHILQDVELENY